VISPEQEMRELTGQVLGAFLTAYRRIGYGFPESVSSNALAVGLQRRKIAYKREVPLELIYDGVSLGVFRADFVVDDSLILEVKSTKTIVEADELQLLNYLRASRFAIGLLLHFGVRHGFRRFVDSNNRKPL